jgi:gliding motility-associated-like protein
MKSKIIVIFILGVVFKQFAQNIYPAVINTTAGGGAVGTTSVELYYNIGEPCIATLSDGFSDLTQGFLQPNIIGEFGLEFTPSVNDESCLNENDGQIILILNSQPSNTSSIKFIWSPSTICPLENCTSIDSLSPGTYSVKISAFDSNSNKIDSVNYSYQIKKSTEPCLINVYNGFSPNGDGINDNWVIDNIENFSVNSVSIFNRWGNKVWNTNNYNNNNNFWDGNHSNGSILTSGTYFYIIDVDNGKAIKKGWVELTGK